MSQNHICTIDGCSRELKCRGLCRMHHQRFLRYGSPHIVKNHRHGLKRHDVYGVWSNMRDRCNNPNNKDYTYYGGRGITVCKRWDDFAVFLLDMGERPKNMTIDRIDTNGPYAPNNCRWATKITQRRNSRHAHYVKYLGENLCIIEWAERLQINYSTLRSRLKTHLPEVAFNM